MSVEKTLQKGFRDFLHGEGVLSLSLSSVLERECKKKNTPIEKILIQENVLDEEAVLEKLSQFTKDPSFLNPSTDRTIKVLSSKNVIIALDDEKAEAISCTALNPVEKSHIKQELNREVSFFLTTPSVFSKLSSHKVRTIETILADANTHFTLSKNDETPLIPDLLDAIIEDACRQDASDIHIHPTGRITNIKCRIDGHLRTIGHIHEDVWKALLVHIKVLSNLNIAETYLPQSGSLQKLFGGDTIDVRVSTHPVHSGESVVLRLLSQKRYIDHVDHVGFLPSIREALKKTIEKRDGLFIVTGPTGSGKTTTLYALLKTIQKPHLNIMTLEQPIEYRIEGAKQTEIQEEGKLSFENGIRSILRQDPDIILVGETRDPETAKMILRSAMTGHQTFTTLHTRTAKGVIQRLQDLGVPLSSLEENLSGVLAQNLFRKLCHHCKVKHTFTYQEKTYHGFQARGCASCHQSGYRGRLVVGELLTFSKGPHTFSQNTHNLPTISKQMLHHIKNGTTSFEEVKPFLEEA